MFFAASWCLGRWIWILPIITNVWIWMSLGTTYGMAVAFNHTFPDFPYISYTGIEEPESGIFTFCVAVAAIMLAANAEMRFVFIRENMNKGRSSYSFHWKRVNIAGLVLALVSSLGLLFVACFQVDTMGAPHITGANVCFVLAVAYVWIQTTLTWKLNRARWEFVWQIVNSITVSIIFVLFYVSRITYKMKRVANPEHTKFDVLRGIYLLSSISEWLLVLSVMFFLLSFIGCFKEFKVITTDVQMIEDNRKYEENGQIHLQERLKMDPES